jgi:hypothetical protein
MSGLYDNFKLQNSREINRYAGAPIAEMTKVGGVLQEAYTENRDTYDTLGQGISSATVLDADKPLFNTQMQKYRTAIADAGKAGNYEDMGTQVRQLSRKFNTDYSPFVRNAALISEEDKDLTDRVAKGTLTGNDAARIKRARNSYTGLQMGADGKYTNSYKARDVSNYVDIPEKITKVLKDMHASKLTKSGLGGAISTEGGRYFVHTERGVEEITPERIKEATSIALNDPMVKAYMKQDADLDYAHLQKVKYEDLDGADSIANQRQVLDANGKPIPVKGKKGSFKMEGYNVDTLKGAAKKYADLNGIPFVDAYKALGAQQAYASKYKELQDKFGRDFSYKQVVDKTELGEETAGSKEARHLREAKKAKELDNNDDLVFESNTTGAPERNFGEITKGIASSSSRLTEIDRQLKLGNLSTIDRDKLTAERSGLSAQVGQDKAMLMNTAKDLTKDLPDVIKGAQIFETGKPLLNGKPTTITRGVITKAVSEGKIRTISGITYIDTPKGTVKLQDSPSVAEGGMNFLRKLAGVADAIGGTNIQDEIGPGRSTSSSNLGGLGRKFDNAVSENSALRQSTNLSMSMKENHKKQLSDYYGGDPNGFEVYKDGKLTTDVPASIDVDRISSEVAGNGNNFISATAKDSKGKKLEGSYKVVLKGNNNLNQQLTKMYKNTGPAGDIKRLTLNKPLFNQISTAEINSPVQLPKPVSLGGHEIHAVIRQKSPNGNIAYYPLDASGNKITDAQGDIYTENPLKLQQILEQK